MGATPTGATPTGPTLDPLNILVNKFNIATHVALILFLFSSWINYLLYDTKSVMVFWQLLSKIKRFVTIFRISWNGPTLFNIPIGDFPPPTVYLRVLRSVIFSTVSIFKRQGLCNGFWEAQNIYWFWSATSRPRPMTQTSTSECRKSWFKVIGIGTVCLSLVVKSNIRTLSVSWCKSTH